MNFEGNRKEIELSESKLKQLTCEFDLSSVFTFSLAYEGVLRNVQCVSFLVNAYEINLSGTHLSDLTWALPLKSLKRLIVRENIITSLDGLQQCSELEYLDVSGNYIDKVEKLSILCDFENLTEVLLKDRAAPENNGKSNSKNSVSQEKKLLTNPLCASVSNYRDIVGEMLKQVEVLDGAVVKRENGSAFYEKCSKVTERLKEALEERQLALKEDAAVDPSFPPELLELPEPIALANPNRTHIKNCFQVLFNLAIGIKTEILHESKELSNKAIQMAEGLRQKYASLSEAAADQNPGLPQKTGGE
eukprot:Nk52_evm2s604 gene=Nk52_evmTU2s604